MVSLKTGFQAIVAFFIARYRKSPGKALGSLILLVGYSYGVFQESFWSDDYPSLTDPNGTYQEVFGDARPIFALLTKYSYIAIGDPQHAWMLRLASLTGLFVLYAIIVSKLGAKNWQIPVFVAIGFTLPSFQMYILWAGCWPHIWAVVLSLTSYDYWSRERIRFKLLGICIMTISFLIYPPSTFFIFSYLFLLVGYRKYYLRQIINEFIQLIFLTGLACSIGLLTSLFSMNMLGIERNSRVELLGIHEVPQKALWIITRPIIVGFRPFMIDSPSALVAFFSSLPLIFLYLAGIYYQSKSLKENYFKRVIALSVLLIFSFIPLMIVKDNQIEFRTIAGFSWGIFIACLIYLQESEFLYRFNFKKITANILILVIALIGIFSININYKQLFRDPYVIKNQFLESAIMRCKQDSNASSILVVDALHPYPVRHRLGVFSTITDIAHGWVTRPNVMIISKKLDVNVPILFSSTLKTIEAEQCIINLEDFRLLLINNRK